MANIPRPHTHKIPGVVMPLAKETHTKDLTKLSHVELLEIKERGEKLLANNIWLRKLPDKGKRIMDYHDRVLAELERRSNIDEATAMLSTLNIANNIKKTLNEIEWNGRNASVGADDPCEDVLDSDDEIDPLRIIAQNTMHQRQLKVLPPETPLITAEDLAEIKSFQSNSPDSGVSNESKEEVHNSVMHDVVNADFVEIDVAEKLSNLKPRLQQVNENLVSSLVNESLHSTTGLPHVEQHVRYLVGKTESHPLTQREKFKPYKTTVTNVHDPDKERHRKQNKYWEVTAATPPPIQHNGAKMLTLLDSVEIQANYLSKLKEVQERQAMERLEARMKRLNEQQVQLPHATVLKTKSSFTEYRNTGNHIEGSLRINENDEVHDPLDEEKSGGGITYTVFND